MAVRRIEMKNLAIVGVMVIATGLAGCTSALPVAPTTGSETGQAAVTAPGDLSAGAMKTGGKGRASEPTIAGIAVGNPDFSTLVSALAKADLVDLFSGDRHFTVFAPTNEAFDKAGAALGFGDGPGLVAALPVDFLTAVLKFHVTLGDRNSTSVVSAGSLRMLDGNTALVTTSMGAAYIQNAKILAVDIRASNGLVHVIDAVILPPGE
jgi:uncharacterized surface protein with fasciclin (FAS1) repeats